MNLGEKLVEARKTLGKTQADLASDLDMSQSRYSKFERGGTGESNEKLQFIVDYLGVDATQTEISNWNEFGGRKMQTEKSKNQTNTTEIQKDIEWLHNNMATKDELSNVSEFMKGLADETIRIDSESIKNIKMEISELKNRLDETPTQQSAELTVVNELMFIRNEALKKENELLAEYIKNHGLITDEV